MPDDSHVVKLGKIIAVGLVVVDGPGGGLDIVVNDKRVIAVGIGVGVGILHSEESRGWLRQARIDEME